MRIVKLIVPVILLSLLSACATASSEQPMELNIQLTIDPAHPSVGEAKLFIDVTDASGNALTGLKVEVSLGMSSMNMGDQNGQAEEVGNGRYVRSVTLHSRGDYVVRLWIKRDGRQIGTKQVKFAVS